MTLAYCGLVTQRPVFPRPEAAKALAAGTRPVWNDRRRIWQSSEISNWLKEKRMHCSCNPVAIAIRWTANVWIRHQCREGSASCVGLTRPLISVRGLGGEPSTRSREIMEPDLPPWTCVTKVRNFRLRRGCTYTKMTPGVSFMWARRKAFGYASGVISQRTGRPTSKPAP